MSSWISRSWIRDREQPLLRAVVQVALEPPALGVTGGDEPLPRGLRVVEEPLVFERERRGRGDRLDQAWVLVERAS